VVEVRKHCLEPDVAVAQDCGQRPVADLLESHLGPLFDLLVPAFARPRGAPLVDGRAVQLRETLVDGRAQRLRDADQLTWRPRLADALEAAQPQHVFGRQVDVRGETQIVRSAR
jgi:hypothetical protein